MATLNSTVVTGDLAVSGNTNVSELRVDNIITSQSANNSGSYIAASAFSSSPPTGVQGQVLFVVQGV